MISNKESLGEHSEKIWGGGESGKSADGLWGSLWANIAVPRALDGQLWNENLEEAPEMTFSHSPLSLREHLVSSGHTFHSLPPSLSELVMPRKARAGADGLRG